MFVSVIHSISRYLRCLIIKNDFKITVIIVIIIKVPTLHIFNSILYSYTKKSEMFKYHPAAYYLKEPSSNGFKWTKLKTKPTHDGSFVILTVAGE